MKLYAGSFFLVLWLAAVGCKDESSMSVEVKSTNEGNFPAGLSKVEGAGGTVTAEDQGGNEADRKVTQAIRKAIVIEPGKDEHSVAARNIIIVTRDGKVTLRGQVKNETEKMDLEQRAKTVPGVTEVDNQLEVKP